VSTVNRVESTYTGSCGSNTNIVGVYRSRVSSGSNYQPGEAPGTPHPYNYTRVSNTRVCTQAFNKITGKYEPVSSGNFPPAIAAPSYNDAYIKALNKLFEKVKGSDFNAAVSTAELNQSVKLIGDSAFRLARAYRAARKGDWNEASQQLLKRHKTSGVKNTASTWLELQYGWMPLIKDVHGAYEFIKARLEDVNLSPVRARAEIEHGMEKALNPQNKWAIAFYRRRVQLLYYPTSRLSLVDALGLTDPLTVAWEKMPYSFVIDWFLPIGPWLNALTAARLLQGKVVMTQSEIYYQFGCTVDNWIYRVEGGESAEEKYLSGTRSIMAALPPPMLPSFKPLHQSLSLQHALNGIALLANLKR